MTGCAVIQNITKGEKTLGERFKGFSNHWKSHLKTQAEEVDTGIVKMFKFKLHYWPAFTAAWSITTFITSYLIAVLRGNVYPVFPYISDTAANPPESCIFGQMLNMGSVFMLITMYLRYVQVKNGIRTFDDIGVSEKWNEWGKRCAIIACLGMSFVANFQELAEPYTHFVGAFAAFGLGSVYCLIQTRISIGFRRICYKNKDCDLDRYTCYFRLFLSFWFLPLFFGHIICNTVSMHLFNSKSILWWTEEHNGYQLRLAASFAEWIMAVFMFLYIISYTKEFKAISFKNVEFECNYQ